jgi:putative heme uptake system protein
MAIELDPQLEPAEVDAAKPRVLLVWDAPNVDMTLASLLGHRPGPKTRPQFDAIGRWLLDRADACDAEAEATIFINVPRDGARVIAPFVHVVRTFGYAVFARPKLEPDDDIDEAMLAHIRAGHADGSLAEVVVASHDGAAFADLLRQMSGEGVQTTVLGFEEYASWALDADGIGFVDLEDISGCFEKPLDRISIDRLPEGGAWLRPLRPLADLRDR